MPNQIPDSEKERRASIIKEISRKKYNAFILRNLNTEKEVLIEKHRDKHSGNLKGVTRNYLTVQIISDREDLFNTLAKIKIIKYENGILYGEFLEN